MIADALKAAVLLFVAVVVQATIMGSILVLDGTPDLVLVLLLVIALLRGAVFVRDGSTLNITAGTRVIGESGSVGTLIIERGGRINAVGTLVSRP